MNLPLGIAVVVAFIWTLFFRGYLPITEGWASMEKMWFPLAMANLAFHEGGHIVFGILGWKFLGIAGGTLMQLLIPVACLFHFLRQQSYGGVGFCLFWLGTNLLNISLYAADAQQQVLILISGMSGSEGGGHDWGYLFDVFGLVPYCVGLAQWLIFFPGAVLLLFGPLWGLTVLVKRFKN